MAQVQVEVPYRKNYDFGIGVDLATGSPMGKVVDGAVSGVTNAGGATTSFRISRIHTTSDLEKTLGLDVKASGGSGCFSASGRMNFVQNSKIHTSSLFLAITATVELENLSIDEPVLTTQAAQLAGRDDVFPNRFGNMFVRGMGRGGIFIGVMQINTMNAEDSKSIASELSGSYGAFSAEAKEKFDEIQKKYHSELSVIVYHEGGPIGLSMGKLDDPNELYMMLQQWLKAFQTNPAESAVPYSATIAPIAIANGPIPPNSAQLQHVQDILVICAKQRSTILDGLNLMEFISQHPSRYEFAAPVTLADIVKAFSGYQADLDLVAEAASHAINHVDAAMTPAEFAKKVGKPYPQGVPPSPMPTQEKGLLDVLAAKGEVIASQDPLAAELRLREPAGPARRGFDIGMAAAEGHTLPGPNKQKMHDSLLPAQQGGFSTAVAFSLERNRNLEFATVGASIAKADPVVAAARTANPSVFFWLGFDIATGIFGDPALKAKGNTQTGPGSLGIRDALSEAGKLGFNASVKLHLGPPAHPRRA